MRTASMRMLTPKILLWRRAAMFSLILVLAACGSKVERWADEIIEKTYKIDPAASLRIRSAGGSVSIRGMDTPEMQLRAVKKARSAAQLNSIGINIAAQTDSVSITTNLLREKNKALSVGTGTVDYTLVVPQTVKIARLELDDGKVLIEGMRGEEVSANLADGQIAIRNCFGKVRVVVANGALDIFYDQSERQQFSVDAQITNGDVRVFIPRHASYHVRAETVNGEITNQFTERVELNDRAVRKIDTSAGKGVLPQIKIRATTGNIKIAEAKPPDIELSERSASNTGNR